MSRYFIKDKGEYIVNFGKHEGEKLINVIKTDYGYIDWMLWKVDFDEDAQELVAEVIQEARDTGVI